MVILNAHDDEDQVGAALTWDIVFPLDPHRFIYMHPDHTPPLDPSRAPRLPAPGTQGTAPRSVLSYPVLDDDLTIRARWASHHLPRGEGKRRAAFTGESFGV